MWEKGKQKREEKGKENNKMDSSARTTRTDREYSSAPFHSRRRMKSRRLVFPFLSSFGHDLINPGCRQIDINIAIKKLFVSSIGPKLDIRSINRICAMYGV